MAWSQLTVTSASRVQVILVPQRTTGEQHIWLIFVFLVETGFDHVGQAGLEFLGSSDPLNSASQSAEIIGMNHGAQPYVILDDSFEHQKVIFFNPE